MSNKIIAVIPAEPLDVETVEKFSDEIAGIAEHLGIEVEVVEATSECTSATVCLCKVDA